MTAGDEFERRRKERRGKPKSKRLMLLLEPLRRIHQLDRHLNNLAGGLLASIHMAVHHISLIY
jgi:hypothetical protein